MGWVRDLTQQQGALTEEFGYNLSVR